MARRASALVLALLTVGCGPVVLPPIPPPHHVELGTNDGYHGFSPETFQFCPHMIRTPQTSGAALHAFMAAVPVGCPVLALVEAPDVTLVTAFAAEQPAAIELGNELELPPYELTPDQYESWIARAAAALDAANYQGAVVTGGVYAITPQTNRAIRQGLHACLEFPRLHCVVSVHLYDASDDDLAYLRTFKDPIWVTETGYPTRCQSAREQEQKAWLEAQIARFSTVPRLERVFIYQRPNGPSCSGLDTFGIEGKPAADLLRN